MQRKWRRWKYKHLTYFLVSLLLVVFLTRIPIFDIVMHELSKAGYGGAFFGGMLYVSSFTAALGAVLLVSLLESVPIIPLSILAGLGGVVGDLLIFRFIRSQLKSELCHLYYALGGQFVSRFLKRSKSLSWLLPALGALIIASPLPDEIGVSMMGITKMSAIHFAVLAFILNVVGIYTLLQLVIPPTQLSSL